MAASFPARHAPLALTFKLDREAWEAAVLTGPDRAG
jgi:hypothetical protein